MSVTGAHRQLKVGLVLAFVGALNGCGGETSEGAGAGSSGASGTAGQGAGPRATRFCGRADDPPCFVDEHCESADGSDPCFRRSAQGICSLLPTVCPVECALGGGVCGCDGTIYCNRCTATRAQTGVDASKSCPVELPPACGGVSGAECPAFFYCDFRKSSSCGADGAIGICSPRPEGCLDFCPPTPPVCLCDGSRPCQACSGLILGVSVAPDDSFCSGIK